MAHVAVQLGNFETRLTFGPPRADRPVLPGVARPDRVHPDLLSAPSLVHLAEPLLLGEEVLERDLHDAEGTFQDFKDHVLHPLAAAQRVAGHRVTHKDAAAAFLKEMVHRLRRDLGEDLDLAVLYPLPGRDALCSWLGAIELPGARSVVPVDEDTAAAIGYGVDLAREDLLLAFDFGFSSIRARVLQFHWCGEGHRSLPLLRGSATLSVGYADLALRVQAPSPVPSLWPTRGNRATGADAGDWKALRDGVDDLASAAEARRALKLVLDDAALDGVRPGDIDRVLLLGCGSRSPAVGDVLRETFGERVMAGLPLVAPLRGALALLDGTAHENLVRETVRLRVRDPVTGEYDYPVVVESHTPCPSPGPTASYLVNTYYEGQRAMDLQIYRAPGGGPRWEEREVVFGAGGRFGFVGLHANDDPEPALPAPLVIPVDPPGCAGQRRFRLEFRVDPEKQLRVTVEDLLARRVLWDEHPVLGLQ